MPVAIVNASIHPVDADPIPTGWILFKDGLITDLGPGDRMFTADTIILDARGKHVYPGLISAYSQLGLVEIETVRASTDTNEVGSLNPETFAAVAVNPDSTLLPVTRSNGILTAATFPIGGTVPGRASVIRLDGWTWEDMAITQDAGLIINWPQTRTINAWWMNRSDDEQSADLRSATRNIEDLFARAESYFAARAADPSLPLDIRFEAMRAVLPIDTNTPPSRPVFIMAQDYDQILAAVDFAAARKLRVVIVGGRDAHLAADILKQHDAAVIVLGCHRLPNRDDAPYDEPFSLPARLEAAGLRWCLASGEETPHERNLPFNAGIAAAHGLAPDAALRAITLSAAEVLGIDATHGSLTRGKAATLIVTTASPLEVTSSVELAFIDGRQIDLANKHTALRDKYLEKYRQLQLIPPANP